MSTQHGGLVGAALVPGAPHLLARDPAPSWRRLADAAREVGDRLRAARPDVVLVMSTQWFTVLGHQFQFDPSPSGQHVDENWYAYEFGRLKYGLQIDVNFAERWVARVSDAGLQARRTRYAGFPIDTGTIVAANLLDPSHELPLSLVSCNLYAQPDAMRQIGGAGVAAAAESGKRYAIVAVSSLSSGLIQRWIEPGEDRIEEAGHDQWNRRILDLIAKGDLDEVMRLREQYSRDAQVDSQLRALPFLLGGGAENCTPEVMEYGPIWGTGNAVIHWRTTAGN